jgi:hypothetical protein
MLFRLPLIWPTKHGALAAERGRGTAVAMTTGATVAPVTAGTAVAGADVDRAGELQATISSSRTLTARWWCMSEPNIRAGFTVSESGCRIRPKLAVSRARQVAC